MDVGAPVPNGTVYRWPQRRRELMPAMAAGPAV